jgi:hypothetical protein
MSEEEACWWAIANSDEAIDKEILTMGDLLKAFEKLVLTKGEGYWLGEVAAQAEYQEGMFDRKGELYPLNLWDEVE